MLPAAESQATKSWALHSVRAGSVSDGRRTAQHRPSLTLPARIGVERTPHPAATAGRTYGPFGMTAMRASGPYSARESATACSTVGTDSTNRPFKISAERPSLTIFTFALRHTFAS